MNFSPSNLRKVWSREFKRLRSAEYRTVSSIAMENKFLKQLSDNNDIAVILAVMPNAIESGVTTIREFSLRFEEFAPLERQEDLRREHFVMTKGKDKQKDLFEELEVLQGKWFPSAEDENRKYKIIRDIDNWIKEEDLVAKEL